MQFPLPASREPESIACEAGELAGELAERYPTAANKHACVFHRPIALTSRMSVNMETRGWGESDIDRK